MMLQNMGAQQMAINDNLINIKEMRAGKYGQQTVLVETPSDRAPILIRKGS